MGEQGTHDMVSKGLLFPDGEERMGRCRRKLVWSFLGLCGNRHPDCRPCEFQHGPCNSQESDTGLLITLLYELHLFRAFESRELHLGTYLSSTAP